MTPTTSTATLLSLQNCARNQKKGHVGHPPSSQNHDDQPLWSTLSFHGYSIWLFTFSDIKTIIGPSLLFAIVTAPALSVFSTTDDLSLHDIISRTPVVLLWIWSNLLPFTIGNQRQLDAIEEDSVNKPWRTMPSKRMTPLAARNLMLCLYPVAVIVSYLVGGLEQCLCLIALGTWYNDFGGSDNSVLLRHLINAAGFNRFTTGALSVMLGSGAHLYTPTLLAWNLVVAAIVFSTVQAQDMYDQKGDLLRNRRTVPLVIGDGPARWSIAIPMVFWGFACPAFMGAPVAGHVLCGGLACLISARSLFLTSVAADKATFRIWNMWLVCVYLLPLLATTRRQM